MTLVFKTTKQSFTTAHSVGERKVLHIQNGCASIICFLVNYPLYKANGLSASSTSQPTILTGVDLDSPYTILLTTLPSKVSGIAVALFQKYRRKIIYFEFREAIQKIIKDL